MWIVRLALRRPYTVAVMCLLILVMGILSVTRMVVDIFPVIDIPVVAVVWNYPGLSAQDMMAQVFAKGFRADIQRRFLCFALFWHALDIIWVGVFSVVYLLGSAV